MLQLYRTLRLLPGLQSLQLNRFLRPSCFLTSIQVPAVTEDTIGATTKPWTRDLGRFMSRALGKFVVLDLMRAVTPS